MVSIEYIYKILDQYSKPLEEISKKTEKMGESAHKSAEHAAKGFNLFRTAVSSILTSEGLIEIGKKALEFGKECVDAASKAEVGMTLLKNTIKNLATTGGPSFEKLEEQANKLSKNSLFTGEQILKGSTQALLQFKSIHGETFERAQKEAIDAATAIYGVNVSEEQLADTSQLIGKAMETGNVKMLRSMGIVFDERTNKQLTYMKQTGQQAALQEKILEAIVNNPKIKNAANAIAETSEGMRRRMANQFELMKIQIGNALLPVVDKIMALGLKIMPVLQMAINNIMPIVAAFTSLIDQLWPIIQELIDAFQPLVSEILSNFIAGLSAIISVLAPVVAWIIKLLVHTGILKGVLIAIGLILIANPIGIIITSIALLIIIIGICVKNWDKIKLAIHNFVEGAKAKIMELWGVVSKLLDNPIIRTFALIFAPWVTVPLLIIKNFEKLKTIIMDIVAIFTGKGGFSKAFSDILSLVTGKPSTMTGNQLTPPSVPPALNPSFNVNTQNTLSVYTEKNQKVVPYKINSNLGYQKVGP